MFIGSVLKERMDMLGLTDDMLIENTLLEETFVKDVLNDRIEFNDIEEFDVEILSNALYCDVKYFDNEAIRSRDVVFCSKNRGVDTVKSNLAKAQIQRYMKDMCWIKEALC